MAKKKDARGTVILECTGCIRNGVNKKVSTGISRYITQKNRHNTPNRLELRKFCPYCYKHMIHGEIKKQIESSLSYPFKERAKMTLYRKNLYSIKNNPI